ncbi:hypothetical protein KDL01_40790, partial [Actinospica durhamensis]
MSFNNPIMPWRELNRTLSWARHGELELADDDLEERDAPDAPDSPDALESPAAPDTSDGPDTSARPPSLRL